MNKESDVIEKLRRNELKLPPLSLELVETYPPRSGLDARVRVRNGSETFDFGLQYAANSTPRTFQATVHRAISENEQTDAFPMVMMPFLSDSQLSELEAHDVSGIDLCGNGVVKVPHKLLVFRTGQPNKYPNSAPIKNIYRRTSSLIARAFLAQPRFESVNDLFSFIKQQRPKPPLREGSRPPMIVLSTVSKALKILEEDLIVGRDSGTIRLLQPEKLLDKLVANYEAPRIREKIQYKVQSDVDIRSVVTNLHTNAVANHISFALTGIASLGKYGVMAHNALPSFYTSSIAMLLSGPNSIEMEQTLWFPDMEILETVDDNVFFDGRQGGIGSLLPFSNSQGYEYASPVQTYLELMAGDKRDMETAEQVKARILQNIAEKSR